MQNLFGTQTALAPIAPTYTPIEAEVAERPQYIPHCTINPNYIVFWDKSTEGKAYFEDGLKDNDHRGNVSAKASKRIRNMISWFTELSKDKSHDTNGNKCNFRLTFATLTLPSEQKHDDMFIKRNMLNRFIIEAKRRWNIINYFWRAEAQENGNIHFHFTFDKFIYHPLLRSLWNDILSDHGYIKAYQQRMQEIYKDGFRMSDNPRDTRDEVTQRNAYQQAKLDNFTNPNSTDIHGIYKVHNVGAYLAKYVSKNLKAYTFTSPEKLWKLKKVFKKLETFVGITEEAAGVFKIKFHETLLPDLEKFIEEQQVVIYALKEKIIRAITGALWSCSDTLRKLKNVTLEMSNDVYTGVMEIMSATKTEEKVIMTKNKYTGELQPNRFVKLFIGKLFEFERTEKGGDEFRCNFHHASKYNDRVKIFFEKVWDNIKGFFEAVHAEETERILQRVKI